MALTTYTTASGYVLPSIHSAPPFFTQQPNPATRDTMTEHWIHIINGYARHKKIYYLRVEDAEAAGSEWTEVLRNERINRRLLASHLSYILETMVEKKVAAYEPPKQTRSVLLYWRLPEEWAEILYEWASSQGSLNTIMTFLDITEPPVDSELTGIPIPLLKQAIAILMKTARAQLITISDGEGVRFLAPK